MQVLLTVGTTEFDALIRTIDDNAEKILTLLKSARFTSFLLQIGRGKCQALKLQQVAKESFPSVKVEVVRFVPSLEELIQASELVVSHAGAGSILETLRARKPLLVVVNTTLQENHQVELAKAMARQDLLEWCVPETLLETLEGTMLDCGDGEDADVDGGRHGGVKATFAEFPKRDAKAFSDMLDEEMGF